jgi:hypothetical protein
MKLPTNRAPWKASVCAALIGAFVLNVSPGAGASGAQGEPTPTAIPTPLGTPAPAPPQSSDAGEGEEDGITYDEGGGDGGAGGRNQVTARNRTDGRLRIRGNIQLNRIPGPNVGPVNLALAYNDACTDCRSIAVALQVNLISRTATRVAPENASISLNVGRPATENRPEQRCTRCVAVTHAIQYVYSVDDPTRVPDEATELIKEMDRELREIHQSEDIGLSQAEARIDAVIARFSQTPLILDRQRDEKSTPGDPEVQVGDPSAPPGGTLDPTAVPSPTGTPVP